MLIGDSLGAPQSPFSPRRARAPRRRRVPERASSWHDRAVPTVDPTPEIGAAPPAFSGTRLGWRDLPHTVRAEISRLAGAQVVAEVMATSGFTPGFAGVLELVDGQQVFVKAVSPAQNPGSPELARREIVAAAALPPSVPAPRLLWSHDDGDWVLLGFEAVTGRSPELPWRPADLERVL